MDAGGQFCGSGRSGERLLREARVTLAVLAAVSLLSLRQSHLVGIEDVRDMERLYVHMRWCAGAKVSMERKA